MSSISERLEDLSPSKRRLFLQRLKEETARRVDLDSQVPSLRPVSREEGLPLSFAQERLWFLEQLEPGNTAYNIAAAYRLRGPLDVAALERSLNEIVRCHEVLRTTFATMDGRPVQVIAPEMSLTLPVEDLQELPEAEREAEAQRLLTEEAQRPFDLEKGPLLRAALLRLDEEEHVLLLTMHHIVSDGWSMGVFNRELAVLYEAFSVGKPSPLPELPIQYADFAVWQREWLQGEVLEEQLAYWREHLGGDLSVLELPTDRPRPAAQSFRGATQSFVLSGDLTESLKALSRREGVTLFMTLLAAFKTLLYRYTGQEDVVVGSPIAGRNRSEIEGLIGFFVNTLVLRTDLSGNPTFRELLERVREVALGAHARQDLPFEKLVEALQPERDLSRNPLFQVMFAFQNAPMEALMLPGLTVTPLEVESETAQFNLTLSMEETGQGLKGVVEYNTDLFDGVTIERMLGHFETLLEGVVVNPEQRLWELPLLTEAERYQLLVEWNDTEVEYPQDKCIHQLFEEQVERTPGAVAVVFEGEQLTYAELNRRANQLAHYLQKLGVGPEVLVGICVERSLEMVVGLLGILKAGGAYVPLDPAYPKERLAFMLEGTQAPVLLTQERLVEGLPEHEARVVCLDADWEAIAGESTENPDSEVTVDNLAYVIYTSGSTGRPKGVQILHDAVVNLDTMHQRPGLAQQDVLLSVTTLSFDIAVLELFLPLTIGARVELVSRAVAADGVQLMAALAASDATVMQATPATWRLLLGAGWQGDEQLRILCGGEALPRMLANQLLRRDSALWNLYGPTETTVWSAIYEVGQNKGSVSIGQPIANTQIYLLDANLRPVPVGVPRELYIGGAGLARGYLNRPELTAQSFIPDPFSDEPGERLYKTGDLARYLPDGNIEFLGRIDCQVKIRGFRIELGEIETVLGQHPDVRETVVLAREDTPGDKRLVAYVVPRDEQVPTATELRRFLKQKLPDYMIPSAFVLLEVLPLTPNGKVDRRTLPAPNSVRPEMEAAFVAPRTSVEEVLAEIWAEVLGLEQVGIYDNFFELGGNSLLSVQIVSKVRQAGIQLAPKDFIQYQTIAELAAAAGTPQTAQVEQAFITGAVPLTPPQRRFFEFCKRHSFEPRHYNIAHMLEAKQTLDPSLLKRVIQHLLRHHDMLRVRFKRGESGWQQVIADPDDENVPFEYIDLSPLSKPEQKSAIERKAAELQTSLNLSEGPILRVALFNLGARELNRLLIVIHHLAFDGISARIFLEDLETGYDQASRGAAIGLPPKTTSYKHWAQRLVEYAQTEAVQQLDYWLAEPQKWIASLPVDYLGGSNTAASVHTVSVSLSVQETRAIFETLRIYGNQINVQDMLLTSLVQAFSHWTGKRSLPLLLLTHGRQQELFEDVDLSRTVGWFSVPTLVSLDLGESRDFSDALQTIKDQVRQVPGRGICYGCLRYLCRNSEISKELGDLPMEVDFSYHGFIWSLRESTLFRPTPEPIGPTRARQGTRDYLLQIYVYVDKSAGKDQLQSLWKYSKNLYRRSTVTRLAQNFILYRHLGSEGSIVPRSEVQPEVV